MQYRSSKRWRLWCPSLIQYIIDQIRYILLPTIYMRCLVSSHMILTMCTIYAVLHTWKGDFFGISRLDGLDPMLAWGMGSTTGHTAIAMRFEGDDESLYVCESTAKDVYWDRNGIQCTEWKKWIEKAEVSGTTPSSNRFAIVFYIFFYIYTRFHINVTQHT